MKRRFKCLVAYDGTQFSGYQVQPNKRTVQSELERVLKKLHKGADIKVSASGRTDAGVHARGQVIHFDSELNIPLDKWDIALNSLLPDDVVVMNTEEVDGGFHARFDAKGKEYRYFMNLTTKRDPFSRNYAFQYPYPLNISAMREAAAYLIGAHDFTSFCSAKTEVEDKIRELQEIDLKEGEGSLEFRFVGNGFLYNMVRILVGTLLEVGAGERDPNSMRDILEKKDRSFAGKTAPGHGLYLWKVFY
ncbi:tRNA pseudouridine(38-40) synthase TruA [Bacillus sp. DTU_2020_1000418_1_SI_GHA_SEK_038]|uniref:tRNA pseudouridine(38-40) synthase TruA n=1 Tax=Bacillus sp. DTU_2020_1000418_1_SI_GHA_SEK_038 TaxID=3077585 RepID=UPI0028E76D8B|nr:tRNA pseudouridine(38-40) synthase TruA [Bacillus sp. DTU_2020_1000418_1_SI_GHA_SEK_038]WNS75640.1 tRNA pseudouridine(38-40) synthase TruA [Bacillus sp. DTU_2020_1000418_1_SI_GHA_SEK_038]